MDTKTILERYARYYDYLQKLGKFTLRERVTLEDLQLPKGMIQSGYKEMEGCFKGSLISYLCFISTLYLVDLAKKGNPTSLETAEIICNNYSAYKADTVNLLRLFHENPSIALEVIINKEQYALDENIAKKHDGIIVYNDKYRLDEYKIFMLLSSAWYMLFWGGVIINEEPRELLYGLDKEDEEDEEIKYLQLITQLIRS